jgi:hypothetical protein
MASSDRIELMNQQPSILVGNWQGQPPVEGVSSNRKSETGGAPRTAVDRSVVEPTGGGESGKALEEANASGDTQEETLWEGQTSTKLFLPRILIGAAFSIAWVALASATWGFGYSGLAFIAWGSAAGLAIYWILTGVRVFRTRHSHHYRLTPRRLFVRTGLIRRRLDQVELLRVKDIFVTQTLLDTWMGIGHVVIVSSEQTLPRATLYGIEQPRHVMDSIWRQTRDELDRKTARVEQV